MTQWTDELKAKVTKMYLDAQPTADNSMEVVKEIADEIQQSANGVRMILSKAGVYIVKTAAKKASTTAAASGDKPARVSKEAAHARLTDALSSHEQKVDEEIISKMTGKAAMYFAEVLEALK
jgi:hypothetical protein